MQNKQYFLDFLYGHGTVNVLFEPFIGRTHTETLIWRRGEHLWNTPEMYVDTLYSLSQRTRADVVFCDMRTYADAEKVRLLRAIEKYAGPDGVGFGVICDCAKDLAFAENSDAVCAAAVYGDARATRIPVIRMDGTLTEAIACRNAGWYAPDHAERYLKEADGKIRILGGLGREFVLNGSPVNIYAETERLAATYPGQWACGSGFEIPTEHYLELISVLGSFGRIR